MDRRGSVTSTGEIVTYDLVRRESIRGEEKETEFTLINEEPKVYNGPKIGKRHIELVGFAFYYFINQIQRQHISLTVVAMTDPNANPNKNIPTFDWDNKNIILSSFFWGYVAPQVLCGFLMTRYGPKWIAVICTTITSLLGILVPCLAVYTGSAGVIACRALQGVFQGSLVPSVSCFVSRWVPTSEKGRAGAFLLAGGPLATVVSMILSGAISASDYGWPMTYYVYGFLGLIWSLYYAFFGYNSPVAHKTMSEAEKAFIIKSAVDTTKKAQRTPWGKILKSVPFWALVYCFTCYVLVAWILLTEIPTYMSRIMMFNINSNGLLTSFIYLIQWFFTVSTSGLSDFLINRNHLSITASRRLFTTLGMGITSIALVFLTQCTKDTPTRGVFLLMIAAGTLGLTASGVCINNLDLAPNHVGVLQGSVNGFSHIFAILAPLVVQFMVYDEYNPDHWKKVFYLASAVAFSGLMVFNVFGSGEVQPWNEAEEDENTDDPLNE